MRELMPHEAFCFLSEINKTDFSKIRKARKVLYDVLEIIISCAFAVLLIFLNRVFTIDFPNVLIFGFATDIFIKSCHLFCTLHICGFAYGIVTDKQIKSKLIHNGEYDSYPWESDDYIRGMKKPFRAYVKEFYYVDASVCDTNYYLQHLCCYKKDYDKMKIGSHVIIVKFIDDGIVVIPAF